FSVVIIDCPKEIFKPSGQASFTAPCRPFLAGAAVAPAAYDKNPSVGDFHTLEPGRARFIQRF
ncbi:hypothetical protein, partial [Anaerotruncus colihominis]|uniref:hypothetical protein n=1 Tax=Anaerotruncus colihominis TaxID=169435 RepID=UPI003AB27CF0